MRIIASTTMLLITLFSGCSGGGSEVSSKPQSIAETPQPQAKDASVIPPKPPSI